MSVLKKWAKPKGKTASKEVPQVIDSSRNPYTEVLILTKHSNCVKSLIKVDHYRFLSISEDGLTIVWNIKTGRQITVIKREDRRPFYCGIVVYRQDTHDYVFISSSSDKSLQIWDITSGECLHTMSESSSNVRCLLYVNLSHVICAVGNNLCLWSLDGSLLAVLHSSNTDDMLGVIAITGSRLVARADNRLYVYNTSIQSSKRVEEAVKVTKKLLPHREAITVLENVSDGYFVSGSIDGTVILWRSYDMLPTRYFNSVKHYEGYDHDYPYSIQYIMQLDERYICAAIGFGFGVFDSLTGNRVIEMSNCHHSKVVYLAIVWDNHLLASCSEDGTVRLWGVTAAFDTPPSQPSSSYLYQLLGMGENDVPVWHKGKRVVSLELLGECAGHSGTVQMLLDFNESGIVTGGVDSLVILWKNAEMESMRRTESLRAILYRDK